MEKLKPIDHAIDAQEWSRSFSQTAMWIMTRDFELGNRDLGVAQHYQMRAREWSSEELERLIKLIGGDDESL